MIVKHRPADVRLALRVERGADRSPQIAQRRGLRQCGVVAHEEGAGARDSPRPRQTAGRNGSARVELYFRGGTLTGLIFATYNREIVFGRMIEIFLNSNSNVGVPKTRLLTHYTHSVKFCYLKCTISVCYLWFSVSLA